MPDLDPEVVERAARGLWAAEESLPFNPDQAKWHRDLSRVALLASGLPEQVEELQARLRGDVPEEERWCEYHREQPDHHCPHCTAESHDNWMHRAQAAEAERDRYREALAAAREALDHERHMRRQQLAHGGWVAQVTAAMQATDQALKGD